MPSSVFSATSGLPHLGHIPRFILRLRPAISRFCSLRPTDEDSSSARILSAYLFISADDRRTPVGSSMTARSSSARHTSGAVTPLISASVSANTTRLRNNLRGSPRQTDNAYKCVLFCITGLRISFRVTLFGKVCTHIRLSPSPTIIPLLFLVSMTHIPLCLTQT